MKDKEITIEQMQDFYNYLQGISTPDGFVLSKRGNPKLTPRKAFQVIYILQEHLRIIPDHYEQCWNCKEIFDTDVEGLHWESKARHYCGGCCYLVPYNYDNNQKQ